MNNIENYPRQISSGEIGGQQAGGEQDGPLPSNPENNNSQDGNEISTVGKYFAGFSLIGLTILSALYLIGHWPDRLPAPYETIKPLYTYEWFNVRLAGIVDSGRIRSQMTQPVIEKTGVAPRSPADSVTGKADTAKNQNKGGGTKPKPDSISKAGTLYNVVIINEKNLMHINNILLILVAIGGFIGNMIHIATSFTTFVGNGQYKKSWGLWYIVKPFTAAALAVAVYFVFRGGFLNMSDDSTNINLYGLMTISILAGLFTDRTTIKLKEVFEVLLRPKEDRADPLTEALPQVTNVVAKPLEVGKADTISITGKNLDKKSIVIKIEGQEIKQLKRQSSIIMIDYTLPPDMKNKASVKLEILNEKGEEIYPAKQLMIKAEVPKDNSGGAENSAKLP